jgi:hypothetical protein
METEQHIAERPVDHWRNKGRNQNFLESNENENITYSNLWDTIKGKVHSYKCLHLKKRLLK